MTKERMVKLMVQIDTHIDRMYRVLDVLKTLDRLDECPGYIHVTGFDHRINFMVRSMDEVHQVRAYLRGQFGTWEDHLRMIWYSGGANASWIGELPNEVSIEIWLSCPVTSFPAALQKDGCGFQEITRIETAYVCNKEGA